jgi:hypothetical protein
MLLLHQLELLLLLLLLHLLRPAHVAAVTAGKSAQAAAAAALGGGMMNGPPDSLRPTNSDPTNDVQSGERGDAPAHGRSICVQRCGCCRGGVGAVAVIACGCCRGGRTKGSRGDARLFVLAAVQSEVVLPVAQRKGDERGCTSD